MQEPNSYVMTEQQYLEALVRGMGAMSILPEERVRDSLEFFQEGKPAADVTYLANGVVVNFGFASRVEEPPKEQLNQPTKQLTNQPAMTKKASEEGPPVEKVKEVLVAVLGTSTPLVTTIAKWTAKQRRAAIKWAKGDTVSVARPDFIVPKQPRSKRGAGVAAPQQGGEQGGGGNGGRGFFDSDSESGQDDNE